MPTARHTVAQAVRAFRASPAIDHPNGDKDLLDAEDMLEFVLGRPFEDDDEIEARSLARFRRLVERRVAGEPAAYITGRITFHGLKLVVGRGAFIPRDSSEFLAEQAIRRLRRRHDPVHVDLGTGAGPVALSVAAALPSARVFGSDISARPVALARRNARALGLSNVTFMRGDLFRPLPRRLAGTVDVVSVHPPYVRRGEMRSLPLEITAHEPKESLTDFSATGMVLSRRVAVEAPSWLLPGGWLLVEVSPDRSQAIATLLRRAGFRDVRSTRGQSAVSRVVVGRWGS
ncbi:MAG TPA: HemK/PrmC family methyltransferase [Actinomycetota bacterium]